MPTITFKGPNRDCRVESGEIESLVVRLKRMQVGGDPFEDPMAAAAILERTLGGSPGWRSTELADSANRALLHLLDDMLHEGSLTQPLYCLRSIVAAQLGR